MHQNDAERESEIKRLGEQIQRAMFLAEAESWAYFMHCGDAQRAFSDMRDLINQRPAEYVRALELERGLA